MKFLYRDKDWLYEQLVTKGKTQTQLSEEFGFTKSVVHKWVKKHELQEEITQSKKPLYQNKEFLYEHLINLNKSYQVVSSELDCSPESVRNWSVKLGIDSLIKQRRKMLLDFPEVIKDWDYDKNTRDIETITHGSRYRAYWKCNVCDHPWRTQVKARTGLKSKCPSCSGRVVNDTNRLSTLYPDLIKEWDHFKNTMQPNQVTYASHKTVFWVCSACENSYSATIKNRTISNSGCSDCSGNTVSNKNSFSHNLSKHVMDWNHDKNKLLPNKVSVGSSKLYHWKCHVCSEEWKTTIDNKKKTIKGCPFCSGQRLTSWNNLEADNPELAKEFLVEMNGITPDKVRRGTQERYWWKCLKGHDPFLAAVSNRNQLMSGCPKCSGALRTSYPEQAIFYYLKKVFEDTVSGESLRINESFLEADVFVPQLGLVVEYDGWYWHQNKQDLDEQKTRRFTEEGFEVIRILEKELIPIKYCEILYIEQYYENDLDRVIGLLFSYIEENFDLTKKQNQTISDLKINHKKTREDIHKLYK